MNIVKKTLLVFIIGVLLLLNVFLFKKINGEFNRKILGTQYEYNLDSNFYTNASEQKDLKYFYELIPNKIHQNSTEWLPYLSKNNINADGLNEIINYDINKKADIYRILTLGDSFTFGVFTDTQKNWTELLETSLNEKCKSKKKFEVINIGVPAYDIQYTVRRYKLRGSKYNADLLLWFIKDDDFTTINEYLFPMEKKIADEMKLDRNSKEYVIANNDLYPSWQKAQAELVKDLGEKKLLLLQKKYLSELKKLKSTKLIYITFPFLENKYKSILQSFTNNKDILIFDKLEDIYVKNAFLPDRHPNNYGHKLIADSILNYLNKSKIIPCDI